MKKIKILYIHHSGALAGSPRSLAFLIEKLDKNKYEPYVLVGQDYDGCSKLFGSVGANVIYERGLGAWHGSTVSGISLKKIIRNLIYRFSTYFITKKVYNKIKPDIVHLNSTCLFMCAKAIRKCNKDIPIICHVREPLLDGFWGNILRKNNNKYVNRYIAIDKYDAESMKTNKKIDIIYNFVDLKKYNSTIKSLVLRKELNISENDVICLYLARISKENGTIELINNAKKILETRNDIHFCIVGLKNNTNKYVKNVVGISKKYKNIHIIPFRSDVPEIISSSDINIVPFIKPHFARSIIETSAMGKVSIGSNIGGINELIQDNVTGYLFNSDFSDFENKLLNLVDDIENRKRMSINAEKFALENFDAVKNSNKVFSIYKEVLKDKVNNI